MKAIMINKKRVSRITAWTLSLIGALVLLSFAAGKQGETSCKGVKVNIEGEGFMVEKADILWQMNQVVPKFVGTALSEIPEEEIEKAIRQNPYVERADLFVDLDGLITVNIVQREPLVRIINAAEQSFYIDKNGYKMPLSPNFSPRVLVANGNIGEQPMRRDTLNTAGAKEIFKLAQFFNSKKNEFWKAQIEQIYVKGNGELELIPRIGDHKILLGDAENLDQRMNNLMIFYKKGLARVGWDHYQTINIKYINQVIGVRAGEGPEPDPTDSIALK